MWAMISAIRLAATQGLVEASLLLRGGEMSTQQLEAAGDHGQRIVDLVGGGVGELGDRPERLGAPLGVLRTPLMCDVFQDAPRSSRCLTHARTGN